MPMTSQLYRLYHLRRHLAAVGQKINCLCKRPIEARISNTIVSLGPAHREYWTRLPGPMDEDATIYESPEYARLREASDRLHRRIRRWTACEARIANQADALASEIRAAAKAEGTPLYVRWGPPPASGRSRDHRTGCLEPGVAVYQAYLWRGDIIIPCVGDRASALFIAVGPAYIVEGQQVGWTSDGTPSVRLSSARRTRRRIHII